MYFVTFLVKSIGAVNVLDHRFEKVYITESGKHCVLMSFPDLKDLNRFIHMAAPDYIVADIDFGGVNDGKG